MAGYCAVVIIAWCSIFLLIDIGEITKEECKVMEA